MVIPLRNAVLVGGCQCGAVRYAIHEEPHGGAVVCHCRMCQRAVGGPFLAVFPVKLADFSWTAGEAASFKSSSIAERHFCARCGTTLSYCLLDGEEIDVTVCSVDEPTRVVPTRQGGIESRLEWVGHINELPAKTSAESMGTLLDGCVSHQYHEDEQMNCNR